MTKSAHKKEHHRKKSRSKKTAPRKWSKKVNETSDALDLEQVDADRRRDLSHLDEQHEDHPEPDRIDAILNQHGIEQGYRHHDHAEAFDQASQNRVQHKECAEELQPRQLQADEKPGDLLSHAGIADRIGECVGGIDFEQNIAADPHRRL